MFNIEWDTVGKRKFETGVDRVALYVQKDGAYPNGVAWNGVSSISEKPSGAESTPIYADNIKYLNLVSNEDFAATIVAYTYPDEFALCNGEADAVPGLRVTQQTRKTFGLCYRTLLGNDTEGTDYGYQLHLVYGAIASPSEKERSTVNESPEAAEMSWELSTTPVPITAINPSTKKPFKPSAHLVVDSTTVAPEKLAALEAKLYGTAATDGGEAVPAMLPLPDEVIALLSAK